VFGDIGTSPVYTFRECFNPEHGLPLDAEHVLGALSMIFWALIIVVAVKYVLLIMRADNQGEGGILALPALALEAVRGERSRTLLDLLALGGAALFYGDSMITPAISVLSAVEGLGIAMPALNRFVLSLTAVVLLALFLFQKGGTGRVGHLFGPVMVLWFAVIAVSGALQIAEAPGVLAALNPAHAVGIFSPLRRPASSRSAPSRLPSSAARRSTPIWAILAASRSGSHGSPWCFLLSSSIILDKAP
jgi:KUP system potassium uptake protein